MTIAIAAAHAMEFSTFRRCMGRVHKMSSGEWHYYLWEHQGHKVILLETGIGPKKADGAVAALLKAVKQIDCMINFGSAGMINGGFEVGDTFLADEITDASTGNLLKTNKQMTDKIAAFLSECSKPYHRGRLLTSPEPVAKASQRSKYAREYHVEAVDMEAFALASQALYHGFPFASLKMISDRANALTRLEFWKNIPQVDKALGKLMYGFLDYMKAA